MICEKCVYAEINPKINPDQIRCYHPTVLIAYEEPLLFMLKNEVKQNHCYYYKNKQTPQTTGTKTIKQIIHEILKEKYNNII